MSTSNLVTKRYLINKVAKGTGIDTETACFIYDTLMSELRKGIEHGETIRFPGIGELGLVPSRSFKSNMTGVMIPAHKRLKFNVNVRLARKIRIETREYPIKS